MKKRRLVVVPSDSMEAYEKAGYDWLERYYNPKGYFDEVYALSPYEKGEYEAYGMKILRVEEKDFSTAIKKIQPDIVRGYGGYWPCDYVCKNRVANIPIVVSIHDTENIFPSVKYADLVICMSNIVARKVIELGVDVNRVRILPNRVDTDVFYPITDKNKMKEIQKQFPMGKKYILHIGRKNEQKNLDTLLKALKLLPLEYECIFVGHGDDKVYKNIAQKLSILERTHWIESINNAELPLWYSWADCFCVPSRWEGFGIVFIEAAACGASIITSNIGPMNEYLDHDRSAFLVNNYEDPYNVAQAIRKICEDKNYAEILSKEAICVGKKFDRHKVDELEIEFYKEALSMTPRNLKCNFTFQSWIYGQRLRTFIKSIYR